MTGSLNIRVSSNIKDATAWVRWARRDQHPFAMASALTATAKEARDKEKLALGKHFKLRSTFAKRGLRMKGANKSDHPHSFALVFHIDQFMADHATGATRRPSKGSRRMTVPTSRVKRTKAGRIPKPKKPATLLDKRGLIRKDVLLNPVGRGKKAPLRPFYVLTPVVHIKKTWPFFAGVRRTVFKSYAGHFRRSYQRALAGGPGRTARQGPTLTQGLTLDQHI